MLESFEFWYTLIIFIALTVVLIKEIVNPEIAVFSALMLYIIGDVVSVKEAFSGFSNEGMLTIAILFVVAGTLQNTGAINKLNPFLFGKKNTGLKRKLARILFPISFLSAFLNNTPIVAMLIPSVKSWTEKYNLSPSKFLIPISYATIVGGMCTLIGTSTNLIVHGLLLENNLEGFSFFELAPIGIPVGILTLLYLIFFGHKLLPNRKTPSFNFSEGSREFVIELKVTDQYSHIGKTIEQAGLRHLTGLYLFQIERGKETIAPASSGEKILIEDRLFFTGVPNTIIELQKEPGLQLVKDPHFNLKNYDSDERKTFEVVVSPTSNLIGKSVRDSDFRNVYDGIILAIHRNGERIKKKIGDVILRQGDTLLILANKNFKKKWYNSNQFYLISDSHDTPSKPLWQVYLSLFLFLGMVLLAALKIIPLISAMGLAAIIFVITKSISGRGALNSINWKVLLIIASSFGIAAAVQKSGVANFIAENIIVIANPFGTMGIIIAVYLITVVYGNLIYRNTAVITLFPIVLAVANSLGLAVLPFILTMTIAANSSFATPISYQTNLMVYGPGGYKYADYLKVGMPLQLIVGVLSIILISTLYF
ncbi:MAG: anion permease [Melioribacteraceae bacterium]|nr:anion permease [Melioribacteraceae bacterium]MCF8356092.1 anion permease [Melioribacteraceae bacterium]MCF8395547.1 anion permease [Melioribacteraceae bacterium]MCF8420619.1 anion permease [Melioribacteraceae bacterium]